MKEAEKIKALGTMQGYKKEIENMCAQLEALPLWNPAATLKKECREVLLRMDGLKTRFDRKLVVTIIGPGGAGKSTLMNAIAGTDNLSESGRRRPTTEKTLLLCKEPQDADDLKNVLGENNLLVKVAPDIPFFDHFVLVDTPDTDSTARQAHIPLVQKAIKGSDVLLCVFNAENPKTRDHVDFFADYIPYFQGDALIGVLNKCDRIAVAELKQAILPEFKTYIHAAWNRPLASLFCISARRHLRHPGWEPNAGPRHDFDQYAELQQVIAQSFNRPEYGIESRVENTRHLRNFMLEEVRGTAAKYTGKLLEARGAVARAEQSGLQKAFAAIREEGGGQGLGVNVLLYQRLANRWVGPMGWMIAIWARILIFGTGMMAMFRFGNPIRQVLGVISSLRHFKDAQAHVAGAEKNARVGAAMRGYRVEIMKNWPEIAEQLVQGGFQPSIRRPGHLIPQNQALDATLTGIWQAALGATLDRTSRRFSNFILQVFFNLPILALMGHIGWLTAGHYFSGDYLTTDFFLHAFLTAAIVLFLSFFLFQGCLRLFSSPENIELRTFRRIQEELDPFQQLSLNPLFEQLEIILAL